MDAPSLVPVYGDVLSLDGTFLEPSEDVPQLVVKSFVPYKRFAVRIADDGKDSFGLREGHYAIFRSHAGRIASVQFVLSDWATMSQSDCLRGFSPQWWHYAFEDQRQQQID